MNFLYKVSEFMRGRYGLDSLSFFLLILSFVVSLIMTFIFRLDMYAWPRLFVYALIGIVLWRSLSRNVESRRRENEFFQKLTKPFRKGSQQSNPNGYDNGMYQTTFKETTPSRDTKNYKYLKCPECSAQLRVPKGKGKINVTCPKCRAKFKSKS